MEKQQITFKGLSTKLTEMETVSETVVNWGKSFWSFNRISAGQKRVAGYT